MTATQYLTVEQKEKVLKNLIRFVESGFKRPLFTKDLYNNLNSMFGHIANYDLDTFYFTWFSTKERQGRWFEHTWKAHICGDPAFTRVDIETAFLDWLNKDGKKYYLKLNEEIKQDFENFERNELARLKAKYEH